MNPTVRALLMTLAACSALAAVGCGPTTGGPFQTGWDAPVDPDGDCAFPQNSSGLTIQLPGGHHDLTTEHGVMNAPRLLRDAQGDFTAATAVSGSFLPSLGSTTNQAVPFVGAGLVVMDGDNTCVRLERAAMFKNGQVQNLVLWELHSGGQPANARWPIFTPQNGRVLFLRVQRKGDRLLGSVSQDGGQWTELQPFDVRLPAKVKIGVAAVSTSQTPFQPHFDDFRMAPGG